MDREHSDVETSSTESSSDLEEVQPGNSSTASQAELMAARNEALSRRLEIGYRQLDVLKKENNSKKAQLEKERELRKEATAASARLEKELEKKVFKHARLEKELEKKDLKLARLRKMLAYRPDNSGNPTEQLEQVHGETRKLGVEVPRFQPKNRAVMSLADVSQPVAGPSRLMGKSKQPIPKSSTVGEALHRSQLPPARCTRSKTAVMKPEQKHEPCDSESSSEFSE